MFYNLQINIKKSQLIFTTKHWWLLDDSSLQKEDIMHLNKLNDQSAMFTTDLSN